MEGINIGEILGIILGGGGVVYLIVKSLIDRAKEKRTESIKLSDEVIILRAENVRLIEENKYHERTIKRFIQIETLKDPDGAEALKIWLDE